MDSSPNDRIDRIFRALGDETRRRIWLILGIRPGASTSDLTAAVPRLSRWAVMKHLNVLREAELVQTMPMGRQRRHYRVERSLDVVRGWIEEAD